MSDKIPQVVRLFVCQKCGRNDRFQKMGHKNHYVAGKRCDGTVVNIRYLKEKS